MEIEQIENTPFTTYGNEEEGHIILMGNYRLTERLTKKECIQWIEEMNWNKITQVMMVIKESKLTI